MLNTAGVVKVMDFGIAKVVGTRGMTRTGMQLGTPAYMAPEQIQNKTDRYAHGYLCAGNYAVPNVERTTSVSA